MKTKRSQLQLPLVLLLTAAGCSQVLGLGDYEIDPALDTAGNGGSSGDSSSAGKGGKSAGSSGSTNEGGSPIIPVQGGMAGVPTTPIEGGAGGEGGSSVGQGGMPISEGGSPADCLTSACCSQLGGTPIGQELLVDGGFELGTVAEGLTPWTEESTNDIPAITDDTSFGWEPRDGFYYAYLSGIAGERTTIWSEDVIIPATAVWLELSGYRLFQIDTQDAVNADFAGVGFYSYDNSDPEELPFFWTAPGANSDGWGDAPAWTRFTKSWAAAPHVGQTRYLGIRGESDFYSNDIDTTSSSYLFDSISLKAFHCQP